MFKGHKVKLKKIVLFLFEAFLSDMYTKSQMGLRDQM